MVKKGNSVFVFVTITVILVGALFVSPAAAQKDAGDPNTPISSLTGIMPITQTSNANIPEPFTGTGELAPAASGPTSETIIGADGRTKVTNTTAYPSRAIAYLAVVWADNSKRSCTGWFIGPRTVVTAGHCVWNTATGLAHGWAKSVTVYPGRNGASTPYGATTMHQLFSITGWTTSANPKYDYGAIQTNAPLGNIVGHFSYHWQASASFPGIFTIRGYPMDKPAATMWTTSGSISAVNAFRLWYDMDTYTGQSGSPLYRSFNKICCYVYGMHTYGASIFPNIGNSATRITHSVANNFALWVSTVYP